MNNQPLLDDLALFRVVVRQRSFAAAARETGLSKAAVSKRIGLLEETLQTRLMHRTTRALALTAQGEIVLQWAERILDDVGAMREDITREKGAVNGMIRLCSSSGFGRNQLAPALSAMARDFPQLEFQLELLDRPVDLVGEGFQLDIRVGAVASGNLICRRIAPNRRVLCASPEYLRRHGSPTTPEELSHHQCIAIRERDQEFGHWTLQGPAGTCRVKVKGSLSTSNGEIARAWALDGHGIILRSEWNITADLQSGALVHLLPDYAQQADICAAYPERLASSARLRACVEFLEAWFREQRSYTAKNLLA